MIFRDDLWHFKKYNRKRSVKSVFMVLRDLACPMLIYRKVKQEKN